MTTAAGLQEGDIVAEKYLIEKVLGAGGMGIVVAARHLKLDERVAIKLLLPETLSNSEAVARFEREARAAVKIKSEHVARVIDVGTLASGAPYMVMEHLEGGDLADWVSQRGPLPVDQAVDFLLQAMEAIAEAHALGIVHRDLKPANLFCIRRADGLLSIKVLDFGISKVGGQAPSASEMSMTRTATIMGSPLYMSPEQMESARDVDATTDIWALGVILFQLLTGRTPFEADSVPELIVKIATALPESLTAAMPGAPFALEQAIFRCLQKDRAARYQNVAEFAAAIADFGSKRARASADRIARTIETAGLGTSLVPPPSPGSAIRVAQTTPGSWGATSPSAGSANRVKVGVMAAVAVVGVALAVVLLRSGSPAESAGVTTPPPAPLEIAQQPSLPPVEPPPPAPIPAPPANEARANAQAEVEPPPASRSSGDPAPSGSRGASQGMVRIGITNARPGLAIKVDGRPTRLPLRLPRDKKMHEVTFETPNFRPETRRLRADEGQSITLENKPGFYVP